MLTFVGLGLYDERSITIQGEAAIGNADRVVAEFYTSKLAGTSIEALEAYHETAIEVLDRPAVEEDGQSIIEDAIDRSVAFVTAGDPMISTTHVDLRIAAARQGIETQVIHGTTAESAAASLTGLQNYRFGKATTLPFPYVHGSCMDADPADRVPGSVLDTIRANVTRGLHTLVYLDIKVGIGPSGPDPDHEAYLTASQAATLLSPVLGEDRLAVGVARAGSDSPLVTANALTTLTNYDFGPPLHLLVIPGDIHHIEREALAILGDAPDSVLPPE